MKMRSIVILFLSFSTYVIFLLSGCATSSTESENKSSDTAASQGDNGTSNTAENSTDTGLQDPSVQLSGSTEDTLFHRIGGKSVLESFTNRLIDALKDDAELKKNTALHEAFQKDLDQHKKMFLEFLCAKSGGPCHYSGRSLESVHAPLHLTNKEWKVFRKHFILILHELNVPLKERKELAVLAGQEKKNIIVGH